VNLRHPGVIIILGTEGQRSRSEVQNVPDWLSRLAYLHSDVALFTCATRSIAQSLLRQRVCLSVCLSQPVLCLND